jgi:hypothetical protein
MQRCGYCDKPFEPTKSERSEQRFCKVECRKAWHYRESKRATYAAQVEAAEDQRNGHANGASGPRIGLAELGLLAKLGLVKRRHL